MIPLCIGPKGAWIVAMYNALLKKIHIEVVFSVANLVQKKHVTQVVVIC